MGKRSAEKTNLISLADAIREKGNTSDGLTFPDGMISAIGDLTGLSTRITGTVTEDYSGKTTLDIPITGLSKFQLIYLRRLETNHSTNQLTLDSLVMIMESDGLTKDIDAVTTVNTTDALVNTFSNLNNNSSIRLNTVILQDGYIRLHSDSPFNDGYFFGTYQYEIIGY